MSTPRKAIYAGSFDPPTQGHIWMVEQGLELFDELVVAIGDNPHKQVTYSVEQRLEMLEVCLPKSTKLTIAHFTYSYLVDYSKELGAQYILRGIRSSTDYEYERVMKQINSDLAPEINTVFLMPPRHIAEVSSSMIKSLIGPKGWEKTVAKYLPESILNKL